MDLNSLNQRIMESGLKKTKIAREVGIHNTHLSRILNGHTKRSPNPKIIKRILKTISKNLK